MAYPPAQTLLVRASLRIGEQATHCECLRRELRTYGEDGLDEGAGLQRELGRHVGCVPGAMTFRPGPG